MKLSIPEGCSMLYGPTKDNCLNAMNAIIDCFGIFKLDETAGIEFDKETMDKYKKNFEILMSLSIND